MPADIVYDVDFEAKLQKNERLFADFYINLNDFLAPFLINYLIISMMPFILFEQWWRRKRGPG